MKRNGKGELKNVQIQKLDPGQVDLLLPLFIAYLRFYGQEHDDSVARAYLQTRMDRSDCTVFMATADGEPAGFTLLYPGFDSVCLYSAWTLHDLYVAPEFRRCGLGRGLMEVAHEYCRAQGAGRVDLATAVTNTVAQPLYESMGYVRDEEFYSYSLELKD